MSNVLSDANAEEAGLTLLFAENAAQSALIDALLGEPSPAPASAPTIASPAADMVRASSVINLAAFRDAKAKELDATDKGLLRANRNIRAVKEPATLRKMASMVGLTIDEVHRRMTRMETLGVLQHRPICSQKPLPRKPDRHVANQGAAMSQIETETDGSVSV